MLLVQEIGQVVVPINYQSLRALLGLTNALRPNPKSGDYTTSVRRRRRIATTAPIRTVPNSTMLPGSGVFSPDDELTPVRKSIGGRLTVLPLLPQARKLSRSVV